MPIAYELVLIHARNWVLWHSDYHLLSHYLITPDLESQVRWTLVVSITCVDTFTTSTRSGGATSCNASCFTHWTSQLVNDQFHMVVQVCWLLCSSGTFCSTWAGRLWLRHLARWWRSFSLRYSVRALGLWQYGWYVMMRAWCSGWLRLRMPGQRQRELVNVVEDSKHNAETSHAQRPKQ